MLTDTAVRKAKGGEKPYRLTDGHGLALFVSTAGGKSWRYRYDFGGSEKTLTIGKYPAIGLADARSARDAARRMLAEGKDPAVAKRVAKAASAASSATTFEIVAREWYALNASRWVDRHAADVIESLEGTRSLRSALCHLPI